MSDIDLFRRSVVETIQCWPSFQIAIQNGLGGANAPEKIEWMCDGIVQLFNDNNDLLVDDLIDFISEIVDNEFDTIIEDGSTEMVCSNIYTYYIKIQSGNSQFVNEKLQSIKEKQAELNQMNTSNPNSQPINTPDITVSNEKLANSEDVEMDNPDENENDGWTVVKKKR